MAGVKAEDRLGITCPGSSKFYVCPGRPARFVGCCGVNPCDTSDGNCPQESLAATSFNETAYDDIPAQACVVKEPGTAWYACAKTDPPFMGCCAVNPCSAFGCPAASLRAGALSKTDKDAAVFLGLPSASSSSAAPSATASGAASAGRDHAGPSTGAIAGISIGATVVVAVLAAVVAIWLRRRRSGGQAKQWQDPSTTPKTEQWDLDSGVSPKLHGTVSQCTTPATMAGSPYMGQQQSQWNSYRPLPAPYDPHQLHLSAELSGASSAGAFKGHDAKPGVDGPAELGVGKPATRHGPVELEDSSAYSRPGGKSVSDGGGYGKENDGRGPAGTG